jgi:hypothetical protein
MATSDLTCERLRELFSYDEESGLFRRRECADRSESGKIASGKVRSGHIKFRVAGRKYYAHRLAFLYMNGVWPSVHIDHKDGDPSNNAWRNLREAFGNINQQNLRRARAGKGTPIGVHKHGSKFQACICVDLVRHHLGTFKTEKEAHDAYIEAKRRLHAGCTI